MGIGRTGVIQEANPGKTRPFRSAPAGGLCEYTGAAAGFCLFVTGLWYHDNGMRVRLRTRKRSMASRRCAARGPSGMTSKGPNPGKTRPFRSAPAGGLCEYPGAAAGFCLFVTGLWCHDNGIRVRLRTCKRSMASRRCAARVAKAPISQRASRRAL